jgi:hypothetical protein
MITAISHVLLDWFKGNLQEKPIFDGEKHGFL